MPIPTCLPRETLKQYLIGTIAEDRSSQIEAHLAKCHSCERAVVELENHPDAMLEFVKDTKDLPSQAKSVEAEIPSVVQRAMAAARQLSQPTEGVTDPLKKPRQIGAYELLRQLGRGGMGQVVLARHLNLHKEVAIKLLTSLPGDRPELVARFEREIRAAGRLNHPAIVNATDAGQDQGTHYLVMEYIDGFDLSRVARLASPLSIGDACELARQTAVGLSYAHAEGIVHRDIKPSNLMLDASGRVKILDFGLAQLSVWDEAACELTTVGQLMGTLDYMAPEQAERSGPVDYRADLYALGATLFRMLAGRPPLAAAPSMTLLEKVRLLGSQTPPLLTSLREDCPPALAEFVRKLLSRDPAERPASAAHVAEALLPYCAGAAVTGLLERAQARAALSGEQNEVEQQLPTRALSRLQFGDPAQASAPPNRTWAWLAAAALFAVAAVAGILITLETQKGQLVIQSEVADVHVKLRSEGQIVNELVVHPGAQSTRLRADKYEITIDAPSDQVVIDKQQFSIKSGETVVATIKQIEPEPAFSKSDQPAILDTAAAAQSAPAGARNITASRATFSGRTLADWLGTFESERDPKIQKEAINAIAKLVDNTNASAVTERLLAVARQGDVSTWSNKPAVLKVVLHGFGTRRSDRPTPYNLDRYVFECLLAIHSEERFRELLRSELLRGTDEWTARWLAVLLQASEGYFPGMDLVEHFLDPGALGQYGADSRPLALHYALHSLQRDAAHAKKWADLAVDAVSAYPALGKLAVLKFDRMAFPPSDPGLRDSNSRDGQIIVEESIARFAKKILADDASTPEELARAATRLANTTDIVDSWRAELIDILKNRFRRLVAEPRRIAAVIAGEVAIPPQAGKNFLSSTPMHRVQFINSEPLAYLVLGQRLSVVEELSHELTALLDTTSDAWRRTTLTTRPKGGLSARWPFSEAELKSLPKPLDSIPQGDWALSFIHTQISDAASTAGIKSPLDSPLLKALRRNDARLKFELLDEDSDGKLSKDEFAKSGSNLSFQDLDGDGAMDQEETLSAYLKFLANENPR